MRPRTDHKDLEAFHEDLIVCSACLGGEIPQKILQGRIEEAEETAKWFKSIFGDDYYIELMRHEVKDPSVRANRETYSLQVEVNKELLRIAQKYDIKCVCTNDSHFVDEENAEAHDRLICLATGKDLDDPKRMLYTKQEWFKTRAEMNEVFADLPEALANTCEVIKLRLTLLTTHLSCLTLPFPNHLARKRNTERNTPKKTSSMNLHVMRTTKLS